MMYGYGNYSDANASIAPEPSMLLDSSFQVLWDFLQFIERWGQARAPEQPVLVIPPYCDSYGGWHAEVRDGRQTWRVSYSNGVWDPMDRACLGPKG